MKKISLSLLVASTVLLASCGASTYNAKSNGGYMNSIYYASTEEVAPAVSATTTTSASYNSLKGRTAQAITSSNGLFGSKAVDTVYVGENDVVNVDYNPNKDYVIMDDEESYEARLTKFDSPTYTVNIIVDPYEINWYSPFWTPYAYGYAWLDPMAYHWEVLRFRSYGTLHPLFWRHYYRYAWWGVYPSYYYYDYYHPYYRYGSYNYWTTWGDYHRFWRDDWYGRGRSYHYGRRDGIINRRGSVNRSSVSRDRIVASSDRGRSGSSYRKEPTMNVVRRASVSRGTERADRGATVRSRRDDRAVSSSDRNASVSRRDNNNNNDRVVYHGRDGVNRRGEGRDVEGRDGNRINQQDRGTGSGVSRPNSGNRPASVSGSGSRPSSVSRSGGSSSRSSSYRPAASSMRGSSSSRSGRSLSRSSNSRSYSSSSSSYSSSSSSYSSSSSNSSGSSYSSGSSSSSGSSGRSGSSSRR